MATTPDFGTPLVAASQAQSEITHNEAVKRCEVLAAGIAWQFRAAPYGDEVDGDVIMVSSPATGDFAGHENEIAFYWGGSWRFIPDVDSDGVEIPIGERHRGLRMYVQHYFAYSPMQGATVQWSGTAWVQV
jgi:hypothetical protein